MKLFDTHCHLDFPKLYDNLEAVLQNATDAGVAYMVTIGASDGLAPNESAVKLAESNERIFCTVGVHPHDASKVTDEELGGLFEKYGKHPRVVGIGETGLDYYYNHSPRERQIDVFRYQLRYSKEVGKPVVIHARDADDDTIALLREEKVTGGILHCFTAGQAMATVLIEELDFYISFSGIATYKNAQDVLEVAKYVPIERILVETDAPFLAPVPKRGKTNEPAFVAHTAKFIADARQMSLDDFADATFANSLRVYGLESLQPSL